MELNIRRGDAPHIDEVDLAYYFLYLAKKEKLEMTQQKLHKLIFMVVAFGLYYKSKRLIKTPTICWMYGPIYPNLHPRFKHHRGNDVVGCYREDRLTELTEVLRCCTQLEDLRETVSLVWGRYKKTSAIDISDRCWKLLYPKRNWLRDFWNQKMRQVWEVSDEKIVKGLALYHKNAFTISL